MTRITGGIAGRLDRWMMRHLRRKGWLVFWLDPEARHCSSVCWLAEYEKSEGRTPKVAALPPTLVHWKTHGLNPTKRYVRSSGHGWEQADDLNGPWTRV